MRGSQVLHKNPSILPKSRDMKDHSCELVPSVLSMFRGDCRVLIDVSDCEKYFSTFPSDNLMTVLHRLLIGMCPVLELCMIVFIRNIVQNCFLWRKRMLKALFFCLSWTRIVERGSRRPTMQYFSMLVPAKHPSNVFQNQSSAVYPQNDFRRNLITL